MYGKFNLHTHTYTNVYNIYVYMYIIYIYVVTRVYQKSINTTKCEYTRTQPTP